MGVQGDGGVEDGDTGAELRGMGCVWINEEVGGKQMGKEAMEWV